jgi:hypothetical protein
MTPTRNPKPLTAGLLFLTLLVGVSLWNGCGCDGAGTIHIESPKARRQVVQNGAAAATEATAKPDASVMRRKSPGRSAIKKHAAKIR